MGTTAAQKKLFFNLRRMKKQLEAYDDTDLSPEDLTKIATDLGVPEQEVINMNRRMMMGGDGSLNTPMRGGEEGSGEWQDWLTDDRPLQDETVADAQEAEVRHEMLVEAMDALNEREQHILIAYQQERIRAVLLGTLGIRRPRSQVSGEQCCAAEDMLAGIVSRRLPETPKTLGNSWELQQSRGIPGNSHKLL